MALDVVGANGISEPSVVASEAGSPSDLASLLTSTQLPAPSVAGAPAVQAILTLDGQELAHRRRNQIWIAPVVQAEPVDQKDGALAVVLTSLA